MKAIAQLGSIFNTIESVDFLSRESLLDFDLLIVDLNALQDYGDSDDWDNKDVRGFKHGDDELITYRKKDLEEFVENGRKLVVITPRPQTYWIGSDRFIIRALDILPIEISTSLLEGQQIEITAKGRLGAFLKKNLDYFRYRAVFDSPNGENIAVVKGTTKSVGKLIEGILFLPMVEIESPYEEQLFLNDLTTVLYEEREQERSKLPLWCEKYLVPDEKNVIATLNAALEEKAQLEVKIKEFESKLNEFQELKTAFAGGGDSLEECVKNIFAEMGFEILEVNPNRDDVIVRFDEKVIVIEVKGVTGSAAEKHAAQLEKWISGYLINHEESPKGVLVVNGFKDIELKDRKESVFPHQMQSYSEKRNHCLITGVQLLGLYFDTLQNPDKKNQIIKTLFETVGVYEGYKNWSGFMDML